MPLIIFSSGSPVTQLYWTPNSHSSEHQPTKHITITISYTISLFRQISLSQDSNWNKVSSHLQTENTGHRLRPLPPWGMHRTHLIRCFKRYAGIWMQCWKPSKDIQSLLLPTPLTWSLNTKHTLLSKQRQSHTMQVSVNWGLGPMWQHRQASWLWETLRSSQTAQRILVKERGSLCQSKAFRTFADSQQKLLAQFVVSLICWKIQLVETGKQKDRHTLNIPCQGNCKVLSYEKGEKEKNTHHILNTISHWWALLFLFCLFTTVSYLGLSQFTLCWWHLCVSTAQCTVRPWSPAGTAAIKHYTTVCFPHLVTQGSSQTCHIHKYYNDKKIFIKHESLTQNSVCCTKFTYKLHPHWFNSAPCITGGSTATLG